MSERSTLLQSIAGTIQDYRLGEIVQPTSNHVDKWINQFDEAVQMPLLREVDFVLQKTYFDKESVAAFLGKVVKSKKLAGPDPCTFWAKANFLQIQGNGQSQKEMLKVFSDALESECGFGIGDCGKPDGDFIYLDDVMFSGNRVANDLAAWIEKHAPQKATIHIVVAAIHRGAEWSVGKRLDAAIAASKKEVQIKYWRMATIENRKAYKNDSEVLWPAELPDEDCVKNYLALPTKFPLELRTPGGKHGPFSSEEGRQLLERELLVAGVKIRAKSQNPKDVIRPLGFSPFGVGFGSMIATFRNCPNNCPIALWWGDPKATSGPFHWYPLLPRKTYA